MNSHGYVTHFLVVLGLCAGLRIVGVNRGTTFKVGLAASVGVEAYQGVTKSGTVEAGDVAAGVLGAAIVYWSKDRAPGPRAVDFNTLRIRAAIRAECDSVSRGTKTLPDSLRAFARQVCR